jgi:nicotinamidase-related amidase
MGTNNPEEQGEMRLARFALALFAALAVGTMLAGCSEEKPVPRSDTGTILLLIDFQNDYLDADGRLPVAQDQVEPMVTAANKMVDAMRKAALDVVYVRNQFSQFSFVGNFARNFSAIRDESGSAFDPRLDATAGVYFNKDSEDAFSNSAFETYLDGSDCGRLVIAGVYADRSVLATARDALARGYKVVVISDAVGAASAQAREVALEKLKKLSAQIETSDQFIAGLTAGTSGQGT